MNIIVIMKQTFDTEEKIIIENGQIMEDNAELIMNPYDEYAVEEAVKLKEDNGGNVTVITVGSEEAESALRTALAMGADKAIFVENEDKDELDEYSIAKILSAVIKDREFDIIIGGNTSIDNGSSQIGPRLAEELGIAHVSTVMNLEVDGNLVKAERDAEGDVEIIETRLPILVTAQQGLNEPRYPSLPGIMKAKKKPVEQIDLEDLDISENEFQAKSKILDHYMPPEKEAGRILHGDIQEQVKELVESLSRKDHVV